MRDRSGPSSPPLPPAMWHLPHSPLPQKTCSPCATSPSAGASIAVPRRASTYAVSLQQSASGSPPGGIVVPLIPFLTASKISAADRRPYLCPGAARAGPMSAPTPSRPWQAVQRWLKMFRASAMACSFPMNCFASAGSGAPPRCA